MKQKISITNDNDLLKEIDQLIKEDIYKNRSKAIEQIINRYFMVGK